MEIITFATHNSGYYSGLMKSAEKNGYPIKVLAYGKEWGGHVDKFYEMKKYIDQQPDDKVCIFLDGFDTIVLRKKHECLQLFQSIHQKGKVLISAGRATQIITTLLFGGIHPKDIGKPYNSLNTGMYMGYVKDLKKLFEVLGPYLKNTNEHDRRMMTHCYIEEKCEPYLQLDTQSDIFYNLELDEHRSYFRAFMNAGEYKAPPATPHYEMTGNPTKPILVKQTQTYPCFVQSTMNANMDAITTQLGYDTKQHNADYDAYSVSTHRHTIKMKILAIFVFLFHLIIYYLTLVHGLISWNLRDLLFILWLQILILVQWYVIGGCWLTNFEKYIHGEMKHPTGGQLSIAAYYCQKFLKIKTEHYDMFITYYPIVYCAIICLKIYYLCSRCATTTNNLNKKNKKKNNKNKKRS
jgi:hypothetical protein